MAGCMQRTCVVMLTSVIFAMRAYHRTRRSPILHCNMSQHCRAAPCWSLCAHLGASSSATHQAAADLRSFLRCWAACHLGAGALSACTDMRRHDQPCLGCARLLEPIAVTAAASYPPAQVAAPCRVSLQSMSVVVSMVGRQRQSPSSAAFLARHMFFLPHLARIWVDGPALLCEVMVCRHRLQARFLDL